MATHTTTCPVCNKECRGVYSHIKIEHPEAFSRLTSDPMRLASNRSSDDLLSEKDAEIASLREEIKANRTSIADFPADEQAAYFVQFVQSLSDSEKATLAEEMRQTADLPQNVAKAESDLKQNADLPQKAQTEAISRLASDSVRLASNRSSGDLPQVEANRKKTILIIGNRRFAVTSR